MYLLSPPGWFFPLIISTKYKFSLRFFSFNYRIFVFIFHSPSLFALFLLLTQPHCPIAWSRWGNERHPRDETPWARISSATCWLFCINGVRELSLGSGFGHRHTFTKAFLPKELLSITFWWASCSRPGYCSLCVALCCKMIPCEWGRCCSHQGNPAL